MDVSIKAFQEATDTFAYLARLDLAELKQKLGMSDSWTACKMVVRKSSSTPPNCAGRRSKPFSKKKKGWMKPPQKDCQSLLPWGICYGG